MEDIALIGGCFETADEKRAHTTLASNKQNQNPYLLRACPEVLAVLLYKVIDVCFFTFRNPV